MSSEGLTPSEPIEPPAAGEYPTTPYPIDQPLAPPVSSAPGYDSPNFVPPLVPDASVPAAEVPPAPPAAPQPPVQPAAPAYPPPAGAYPPPASPPAYVAPPTAFPKASNNAVVALVLAIGSFVVCPLILSIAALIVANSAQKEIDASQGWVTGGGMVTAAKVIAWINIAIAALVVVVILIGLVAASSSGQLNALAH